MKKFLLTAGAFAFASLCLFTSCKDVDELAANVDVEIDTSNLEAAISTNATKNTVNDLMAQATDDGKVTAESTQDVEGNYVVTVTTKDDTGNVVSTAVSTVKTESDTDAEGNITTTVTVETVTTDAEGNTTTTTTKEETTYEYTYTVDGVEYNSLEEVQAALGQKNPGDTVTVIVTLKTTVETYVDGTKTDEKEDTQNQTSTITIPGVGEQEENVIVVPIDSENSTFDINTDITTEIVEPDPHSGGAGE